MSLDLVPQAIEVLERAMRGQPGYGSLDIVKKELQRLQAIEAEKHSPEEERWNAAIDWLLNSRHTADPDIQTPFWAHVDGEITLEELRAT